MHSCNVHLPPYVITIAFILSSSYMYNRHTCVCASYIAAYVLSLNIRVGVVKHYEHCCSLLNSIIELYFYSCVFDKFIYFWLSFLYFVLFYLLNIRM